MCHIGQGTPRDPERALKYYTKAADGGYVHGQVSLGTKPAILLSLTHLADWHHRIGGYHHLVLALKYYRLALNQGHNQSQRKIGMMLHSDACSPPILAQVEQRLAEGILTYSKIFSNYGGYENSRMNSEVEEEKFVPF